MIRFRADARMPYYLSDSSPQTADKATFMSARSTFGILLLLVSIPASAGFNAIPEPGSLELLAIAAAAGVAIAVRKRRK